MTYTEWKAAMRAHEQDRPAEHLTGILVFTQDSFDRVFPRLSRAYLVGSNNKAFQPNTTASQNLSPPEITPQAASELFASCDRNAGRYSPLGLFYLKEGAQYIGIDNSSGNAWTEEFSDLAACLMWLREGACPPFRRVTGAKVAHRKQR